MNIDLRLKINEVDYTDETIAWVSYAKQSHTGLANADTYAETKNNTCLPFQNVRGYRFGDDIGNRVLLQTQIVLFEPGSGTVGISIRHFTRSRPRN